MAKRVNGITIFHLDPASCKFANELHPEKIALEFYDESVDGLSQPWAGNVWLFPPGDGSAWFLEAEKKYMMGEIMSCFCLLKVDFSAEWFSAALSYPHCFFRQKLTFGTPSGRDKTGSLDSYVIIYM